KNGCDGRSTGTSAVPQIADDLVHCASRQMWATDGLMRCSKKVLLDDVSPGRVGLGCRRRPTPNWRLATDRAPGAKRPGLCQPYGEDSADVALICKAAGRLNEEKRGCTRLTARLRPESSKSIMPEST